MTAILGGTFDPVHFGHLRAATEARELLGLQKLFLMPAGNPPHRQSTFAAAAHRVEMLRLAVESYPDLTVDDREVRRGGFSYMVDTLSEVRASLGADQPLLLLTGQDAVNQLDSWKDWQRLFDLAHIVVMRRPDSIVEGSAMLQQELLPRTTLEFALLSSSPAGYVLPLEVTQLAISSTDIRQRLEQKRSCRFLMPDKVIEYIQREGLYGAACPS
jgi:nicotinate-nucleotide adenylyltransferase